MMNTKQSPLRGDCFSGVYCLTLSPDQGER